MYTRCCVIFFVFLAYSTIDVDAWSGPYRSDTRNVTVAKFRSLVSSWFTEKTWNDLLDQIDPLIYEGKSCTEIGLNAMGSMATTLGDKWLALTAFGVKMCMIPLLGGIGPIKGLNALAILKDILFNNICPFVDQLQGELTKLKADHTEEGVVRNGYRMSNQFFTFNRVKTIMQRAKARYVADGTWTTIRNAEIKDWVLFAQYGI